MTAKKITLNTKPSKKQEVSADDWVESRTTEENEPIQRLTIDIPVSLHRNIKAQCAMRGKKIVQEIRELLIQKYGKP